MLPSPPYGPNNLALQDKGGSAYPVDSTDPKG
jgi:hypothetical protein